MVENSSGITDIAQLQNGTFGIMSGSNAGPLLAIKLNELGIIGDEIILEYRRGNPVPRRLCEKVRFVCRPFSGAEVGEVRCCGNGRTLPTRYQ